MKVKEEFGSAPGEKEAGRVKQNASFLSFLLVFSRVCGVRGEGERGAPTRTLRKLGLLGNY